MANIFKGLPNNKYFVSLKLGPVDCLVLKSRRKISFDLGVGGKWLQRLRLFFASYSSSTDEFFGSHPFDLAALSLKHPNVIAMVTTRETS